MEEDDALPPFEVPMMNNHLPNEISFPGLPGPNEANTAPLSLGDEAILPLGDESNLPLYPIHRGGSPPVPRHRRILEAVRVRPQYMDSPDGEHLYHNPARVDNIINQIDRMFAMDNNPDRIGINMSPDHVSDDQNSNEAANMVAALVENLEPIIIESDDSNSSTIPDVSASRDLPLDDEEAEPPSKFAKMELPTRQDDTDEDNDGQTCSICLEGWTASGEHRLSALKCGHLFGHSCIDRWLKQTTRNNRCCPSCKTRACMKDIRFIYAKRIAVVDNSEIDSLKTQLESTKTEKNRIEMELHRAMTSQQLFFHKITKLEREIIQLKQAVVQTVSAPKSWKYALRSNLEVCKDASCRVLAYNSRSKELYVSQMSTNCLFQGYAMRKLSCHDWKFGKLVHLHPKLIRDASYSEENDLLVTVGLDKAVKLIQGTNETITTTISAEMPLWSCCWDDSNQNRFYVGGVGGIVLEYDIRQPRACIMRIAPDNDMSPVASLAPAPCGVLACHLNSFRAHFKRGSTYESRTMPIDGSLLCVRRNKHTEDILVSSRPSGNHQRSRHMLCKLNMSNDFEFEVTKKFEASNVQSLMTRSAIYSIGDESFVAAHSESDKAVCVWSVNSERRSLLAASDNVVDVLPITRNECGDLTHLVTLSQSKIRIYEAIAEE